MFFFKGFFVTISNFKIDVISISLKVVSIAVSFLTATNREAIFLLRDDIFFLFCPLSPDEEPKLIKSKTSFFVILPASPDPVKSSADISCLLIITDASGVALLILTLLIGGGYI